MPLRLVLVEHQWRDADLIGVAHKVVGSPFLVIVLDTVGFVQVASEVCEDLLKLEAEEDIFGLLEEGESEAEDGFDAFGKDDVHDPIDERERETVGEECHEPLAGEHGALDALADEMVVE